MTTCINDLTLDMIITGYCQAMEFVTVECSDFWEDQPVTEDRYLGYSQDLIKEVEKFCAWFYRDNLEYLECVDNDQAVLIGQDLYFTSQGHGVGFWESSKDYPNAATFDRWITDNGIYRDQEYVGDDGYLYSI